VPLRPPLTLSYPNIIPTGGPRLHLRSRFIVDTVAPAPAWHFPDAAPVPGRHWLRYLHDTPRPDGGPPPAGRHLLRCGRSRPQKRRRPSVLVELGLVEQRYKAVCEVLDGVTDVARRNGVARQTVHDQSRPPSTNRAAARAGEDRLLMPGLRRPVETKVVGSVRACERGRRCRAPRRHGRSARLATRQTCRRVGRSRHPRTRSLPASSATRHGAARRRFSRSRDRCPATPRAAPAGRWRCRRTAAHRRGAGPGGARRTPPACPGTG